jgi:hypothetical protein
MPFLISSSRLLEYPGGGRDSRGLRLYDGLRLHKGSLNGRPLVAITTDHKREYKGILDELGAAHQLCLFHLCKMIGDVVYAALQSKRYSYSDKIAFCIYFTAIKNIFRTNDLQVAQERL